MPITIKTSNRSLSKLDFFLKGIPYLKTRCSFLGVFANIGLHHHVKFNTTNILVHINSMFNSSYYIYFSKTEPLKQLFMSALCFSIYPGSLRPYKKIHKESSINQVTKHRVTTNYTILHDIHLPFSRRKVSPSSPRPQAVKERN